MDKLDLFRGRISSFLDHRGFGFIEIPGQPDAFIHINDRRTAHLRPTGPIFGAPIRNQRGSPNERRPIPGEEIVFHISYGLENKPGANPWAFADEWDAAVPQPVIEGEVTEPKGIYGFIKGPSGEVFYHMDDLRFVNGRLPNVTFHELWPASLLSYRRRPFQGDCLVFQTTYDRLGRPKAQPWGYARFLHLNTELKIFDG